MKKQNLCNLILGCTMAVLTAVLTAGCSSVLSYSGEDFDKSYSKTVQTNESFVFSTYLKESPAEKIAVRAGVSKAPLEGVLVLYFELTNQSDGTKTFNVREVIASAAEKRLAMINPSEYINAYQGEQIGMVASMQAMAPTLRNMATISNNAFANDSRNTVNEYAANDSATKEIYDIVNGISAHTLNTAVTIKPYSKNYYYIFYQDIDEYPVNIEYKDLKYSFVGKSLGKANNEK